MKHEGWLMSFYHFTGFGSTRECKLKPMFELDYVRVQPTNTKLNSKPYLSGQKLTGELKPKPELTFVSG
jgi:hypothetical protein